MLLVISPVGAECKGDPTKIVIGDTGTGTSVMTTDYHMLLFASPRVLCIYILIRCCSCYDAWHWLHGRLRQRYSNSGGSADILTLGAENTSPRNDVDNEATKSFSDVSIEPTCTYSHPRSSAACHLSGWYHDSRDCYP